jgi:uncharacterized protein
MQHEESMGDRGGHRGEEAPERLCAVTRRAQDPAQLLRFVAGPDGAMVPDLAHKLPGRGVWLTATRTVVLQAIRQKAFARSLKRAVTADDKLADLVGDLMLRRVLEYLALANKAGIVSTGFSKVDRLLERGTAFALLHGSDGAEDGVRKLDQKFVHVLREAGVPEADRGRRTVRFLTSQELSLAMGRTNVVHAGLLVGGASRKFLSEAERLLRYRLGVPAILAA